MPSREQLKVGQVWRSVYGVEYKPLAFFKDFVWTEVRYPRSKMQPKEPETLTKSFYDTQLTLHYDPNDPI